MAKKIWYSTPLKFFWEELYKKQKQYTPEFTDEQVFKALRFNLIKAPLKDRENMESRELILSGLELWREDSLGKFLHVFFLDKPLRDFLENTPLSDLEGIRDYLYLNGKNKNIIYFKTKTQTDCVTYSFGLHIPYEKNGYAFSLSLFKDNSIELYFSKGSNNGHLSDKFYNDLIKKKDVESIELSKVFRLAINTITYMKCFPECVSEGVPKITKSRNEIRSKANIIFTLSEKVTKPKGTQFSKIPHFRRGHFKVLKSDYFTNKKGQIIYVPETMVKGKAKTVSQSEQIEKFNKSMKK